MRKLLFLCLVLVAFAAFGQTNDDKIPQSLLTAKFVYVQPYNGDGDVFDPNVSAEDRQAIADVTKALQKWGQYKLAAKRSAADLVMAVRVGRAVSAYMGGKVGASSGPVNGKPIIGAGPIYGGETGNKQDVLLVFLRNPEGALAGPLWQNSLDHGLETPDLPLFQQFRKDISQAIVAQNKKKTP